MFNQGDLVGKIPDWDWVNASSWRGVHLMFGQTVDELRANRTFQGTKCMTRSQNFAHEGALGKRSSFTTHSNKEYKSILQRGAIKAGCWKQNKLGHYLSRWYGNCWLFRQNPNFLNESYHCINDGKPVFCALNQFFTFLPLLLVLLEFTKDKEAIHVRIRA